MNRHQYKSKIGWIQIEANNNKITGLKFITEPATILHSDNDTIQQCQKELDEYFNKERTQFNVKLEFEGTDFQKKVWENLLKIPYGKTISYADLAKSCGSPKAFRAAGSANGKNAIAIIIPCHRVINSNGELGGYAYGLKIKQELLDLEQIV